MNSFYDIIVDINSELSKAFEELSETFTTQKWKKLQDEFHETIETNFPAVRCEISTEIADEKNLIPEKISKRIKVAAMLLNILALGGKYNRNLYLKTLDFCTTASVKNGSFA